MFWCFLGFRKRGFLVEVGQYSHKLGYTCWKNIFKNETKKIHKHKSDIANLTVRIVNVPKVKLERMTIDSHHLIFGSTSVCMCACVMQSGGPQATAVGGEQEAWTSEALCTATQQHTTRTQIPFSRSRGLIAEPQQSERDHDTGDDIKKAKGKRADRGGSKTKVNSESEWIGKKNHTGSYW